MENSSAQALRDRFAEFGAEACSSGVRLEEAMSAAVAALQDLFDRTGGQGGDPATALAAGTALAALAEAFHEADASRGDAEPAVGDAPLPWLAALHRINRSATADLNLSDRLKTAVRVLADTTGADACGILLYDETTDTLALRAAVGLNPVAVGALTLHPGTSITGLAAAEQRVIAAPDARLPSGLHLNSGHRRRRLRLADRRADGPPPRRRAGRSSSACSISSPFIAANSPRTRSRSCRRSPAS